MNGLTVFNNAEFGSVRTILIENEPWFVGKDVAEALGYGCGNNKSKALTNAINDHVDEEDKILLPYNEFKGYQNGDLKNISHYGAYVINESGLYSLIMSSKLPSAKRFKHWVTSEVLPSIRKNGCYGNTPLKDVVSLIRITQSNMEKQGATPSQIAETIDGIAKQYGIDLPNFVVKPETLSLKDVYDMVEFVYSHPKGRGHRIPTYDDFICFRATQIKELKS